VKGFKILILSFWFQRVFSTRPVHVSNALQLHVLKTMQGVLCTSSYYEAETAVARRCGAWSIKPRLQLGERRDGDGVLVSVRQHRDVRAPLVQRHSLLLSLFAKLAVHPLV
jgi:hypothetical protein